MKRPHEETWRYDDSGWIEKVEGGKDVEAVAMVTGPQTDGPLLAAAPAMARILLKLQTDDAGRCLTCRHWVDDGHLESCEWLLALRAAGVVP